MSRIRKNRTRISTTFATAALAATAFATDASAWSDPAVVSGTSAYSASRPSIAIDGKDRTVVAWTRPDASFDYAQAAIRPAGADFSAPVNISFPSPYAIRLRLAAAKKGPVVASWLQSDGSILHTQVAELAPGASVFTIPVAVSPATYDVSEVTPAVDSKGNVTVAWVASGDSTTKVQAVRRSAKGTFGSVEDVAVGVGVAAQHLHVKTDKKGNKLAFWQAADGGGIKISASYGATGAPFAAAEDISVANGSYDYSPTGGFDSKGNAIVAWSSLVSADYSLVFTERPAKATTFQVPTIVSTDATANSQMTFDRKGNANLFWNRAYALGAYTIDTATRPAGGAWGASSVISAGPPVNSAMYEEPAVVTDGKGNVRAVWSDYDGSGGYTIRAAVRPVGGSWSLPVGISSPGCTFTSSPTIAVDRKGNATAAWTCTVGGVDKVEVATDPAP